MCILFFFNNPYPSENQYRLILASNRDEFFNRLTKQADYWNESSTIIGGRDLEADAKGTWLALSTKGKMVALLNVWSPMKTNVESRGLLTMNFLKSDYSGMEYINNVFNDDKYVYNGYNLLLFDIGLERINVTYGTNAEYYGNYKRTLPEGVHAFGNTTMNNPLCKVSNGKKLFTSIISAYHSVEQKDILLDRLLAFLKSDKRYPDMVSDDSYHEKCDSIFVNIPNTNYGTRTHTIVLLDFHGNIEFHEWTMKFNSASDTNVSKWVHSQLNDKLFQ